MNNFEPSPVIPERRKRPAVRRRIPGAVPILLTGIITVVLIWIFGRTVFVSNSAEVPKGLDTETINTNVFVPEDEPYYEPEEQVTAVPETELPDSSLGETTASDESKAEAIGVLYVTEYVQLHKEPSNESENIICMSPGIAVDVLEYDPSGYVKVTFMNVDGQKTGYVWKDYLSEVQTVIPAWQQ